MNVQKSLRISIVFVLLVSFQVLPQVQKGSTVILDSLIQEALRHNPEIRAARHQSQASRSRIRMATAWEPPEIGVEFYQTPAASFPNPVKDQMETDYFIEQMIHFPGKLGATGKTARFGALMAEEEARVVERRVIFDLKSAYSEIYWIQKKIELNSENQRLMSQALDVASRQYEVGTGTQTDMLRGRTELSRLAVEALALGREKRSMEAMLNVLLDRPLDGSFSRIDTLDFDFPDWTLEQIDSLALIFRPGFRAMKFEVAMNQAEVVAARWDYAPDFTTRLMYKDMTMTSKDFWSFMIGISLPLSPWAYPKSAGRVQEMTASVRKSEASLDHMKNRVLLDVQNAWSSMKTNREIIELNRKTVIPQADMAVRSAAAAYATGRVPFVMLIDTYRMALSAGLDYHMAVMNFISSQAKLEEAVGLGIVEIEERIRSSAPMTGGLR
jgi:cobalt-zinc-cadmium efflux system outer membrane protein